MKADVTEYGRVLEEVETARSPLDTSRVELDTFVEKVHLIRQLTRDSWGMLISSTPFSSFTRSYDSALSSQVFSIRRRFTCFPLFPVCLAFFIFTRNWSKWLKKENNNNFADNFLDLDTWDVIIFQVKYLLFASCDIVFFCTAPLLCRNIFSGYQHDYLYYHKFHNFSFSWSLFVASNFYHRFTCFAVRWIFFKSLELLFFFAIL